MLKDLTGKEKIKYVIPRAVCVTAVLVLMCFIFGNSTDNAEESSDKSSFVTEILQKAADVVSPGTTVNENSVRKCAHFIEFTALGALAMLTLRVFTEKYMTHITAPLFYVLAVAVSDEFIQINSSGRASDVRDVLIDFSGALTGTLLCLLFIVLVGYIGKKIGQG